MTLKQTKSNLVSRLSTNLLRITHACNIATYEVLGLALQTARGTKYLCNIGWLGAISIEEIWKPTTERSVKGENLDVPIRAKINSTKWKRVSNRCTDVTTYFGDSHTSGKKKHRHQNAARMQPWTKNMSRARSANHKTWKEAKYAMQEHTSRTSLRLTKARSPHKCSDSKPTQHLL